MIEAENFSLFCEGLKFNLCDQDPVPHWETERLYFDVRNQHLFIGIFREPNYRVQIAISASEIKSLLENVGVDSTLDWIRDQLRGKTAEIGTPKSFSHF